QVDPVSFSPDGGTYSSPQTVLITCPTEGAVIHYTTTGLDPTESDPVVSGPVLVDRSLMLKARAYKDGMVASEVKSAEYFLGGSIVLHVSPDGSDTNDGLSWAASKRTVQAALNAAVPGDRVWVAAGTYNEPIALMRGVALYGGFAGV
ncbi:MAG: chitobiase/beta-hexosaminidase C-terminal domain-containing protein, partial [Armatimonadetes bacterium]|nr:chitobiase/beta-hexosaminidase C-terminal domain-containing protein [Armatimonadota bacterium]